MQILDPSWFWDARYGVQNCIFIFLYNSEYQLYVMIDSTGFLKNVCVL
jgi:hypothetical protein